MSGDPTSEDAASTVPASEPTRSASFLVALGILFSRISGVFREVVFGSFLGVGGVSDAFTMATRIPNVLQMLLGEGTLSASFIPVYSAELERDEEEAGRIAGAIAAILAVVAAVIVVISVIAAEPIVSVIASNWRGDPRFDLTVSLLRIIFPSAGLLVLSAWCLGILNSHRQFFLSYVAPVLWNIAQITAVIVAAVAFGVGDFAGDITELQDDQRNIEVLGDLGRVAAWGFFVGSALQFLVQVPSVLRLTSDLRFALDLKRPGVREVLRRFSGAVVGRGVVQLSALADLLLAATLISGAVTALSKAQVLYIMPISLFAVSIAASELPELSRMTSTEAIRERAQAGFGRILFFVSFTAVTYILLGDKIIGTIFEYGRFTADDTLLIWFALAAYSLGLIPSALSRLTQNTLWSRGDTTGPARIAIVRVIISIAFAAVLMGLFDRLGTTDVRDALPTLYDGDNRNENLRFGAMGITLGSAIGGWVEALLLWRLARRAVPGVSPFAPLQRLLPALGASAVVAIGMRFVTDDMWPPLAALLSVGLSGLIFVGVCWLRRVPEVDLVLAGPLRRLRRGETNAR